MLHDHLGDVVIKAKLNCIAPHFLRQAQIKVIVQEGGAQQLIGIGHTFGWVVKPVHEIFEYLDGTLEACRLQGIVAISILDEGI